MKIRIFIRGLNTYTNRKIIRYFTFLLFWYLIGIVVLLLIWDNFTYQDPSLGWVVGISWAILSLGGMITNLIAIHKIVEEYKEFLKSTEIFALFGLFDDW